MSDDAPQPDGADHADLQAVQQISAAYDRIRNEIGKAVVGQQDVVEQLLIALFAGGHCLLVGVPGLAKTLMIRTLADALALRFQRIQFTPDLMPSDITGTEVIQEDKASGHRELRFLKGPIFANVVLADEVNRTPPKTQAALLEAMQEHQVTIGGERHRLQEPFFVLATQNPIEQEGTYPLPEAQLDRFMFQVQVDYPDEAEELEIVRRTTADLVTEVQPILGGDEIMSLRHVVRKVPIAEHIALFALRLARRSRPNQLDVPDFIRDYVAWEPVPASQYLVMGAKARAVLQGRHLVTTDDIRAVAAPVLRHRIRLNFSADADGITADELIDRLVESTPLLETDAPRGLVPNLLESSRPREA